jgi:tetratricopeptide (TPR) repeat protein
MALPLTAQAISDDLRTTPFGHVLLDLFDARQTGTLLVYAQDDSLHAAIRIEAGRPRAVLAADNGEHRVTEVLMPMCAWVDGRFEFVDGQDLVGGDGLVASGPIDPLPMITAAARNGLRKDMITQTMALVSRSLIKLSPGLDLKRYAFAAEECLVVRGLDHDALELDELKARVNVPLEVLERVLYVLRVTRGIALSPSQRTVSGIVSHAPPLATASMSPSTPRPIPGAQTLRPARVPREMAGRPASSPLPVSSMPSADDARAQRSRVEALWQQAESLSRRGHHEAALRTAHSAVKLSFPPPAREAQLGWLIYQHDGAGPIANAHVWKCLNRALKREPLCEEALYYKGLVLARTGEPEQAYAHFQRVLMLAPTHGGAEREIRAHDMRRSHEREQGSFLHRLLSTRAPRQ